MRSVLRAIVGIAILGLLQVAAVICGANAQSYPTRSITLVVPYPAGGPSDTLARVIAERMKAALGQTVIIENVTGAGGSIGTGRVARAAPDGYTLSLGHIQTHVINAATQNLQYDVVKDFEPVALIADTPQWLVGAQDAAGRRHERLHRLAQGAGRQGDRRRGRRRRADRPRRGLFPEGDRHQIPACALSRRRAAHPGHAGRPDRLHLRPGGELSRPRAQRPIKALCGAVEEALVGRARRADHG